MNKIQQLTISLTILLSLAATGQAQEIRKKIMTGNINQEALLLDHTALVVGMDEKQQKKNAALQEKLEKDLMNLDADLDILKAQLNKLLIADKPDEKAIENKVVAIGRINTQKHLKKIKTRLAVRAMLTPEQKIKFDKQADGCCSQDKHIQIFKKDFLDDIDCDLNWHEQKDGKTRIIQIKKTCDGKPGEEIKMDVDVELEEE